MFVVTLHVFIQQHRLYTMNDTSWEKGLSSRDQVRSSERLANFEILSSSKQAIKIVILLFRKRKKYKVG